MLSKAERQKKYRKSVKGRQAQMKANLRYREAHGQGTVVPKPKERQRMEKVKTDEQIIEAMELEAYEAEAELPEEVATVDEKARSMMFGKRD